MSPLCKRPGCRTYRALSLLQLLGASIKSSMLFRSIHVVIALLQPQDMSEKQQCLSEKMPTLLADKLRNLVVPMLGKAIYPQSPQRNQLITLLPNRTGRRDLPTSLQYAYLACFPWHIAYSR